MNRGKYIRKLLVLLCLISLSQQIGFSQKSRTEIEDLIYVIDHKAYDFLNYAQYDSAIFYYKKTVALKEILYGPLSRQVGASKLNIAAINTLIFNYDEAIRLYDEVEEAFLADTLSNEGLLYTLYVNRGDIYSYLSDLGESIRYYNYIYDHRKSLINYNINIYNQFIFNYSTTLLILGENDKAIGIAKELMDNSTFLDSEDQFRKYFIIAKVFRAVKNFEVAKDYFEKAYAIYPTMKLSVALNLKMSFSLSYSDFLIETKDFSKAKEIIFNELKLYETSDSKFSSRYTELLLQLARILYLSKEYMNCYKYVSGMLIELEEYINREAFEDQNDNIFIFHPLLLDIQNLKALSLKNIYLQTNDKKYLEEAFQTYISIIDLLTKHKLGMRNENSVMASGETLSDLYTDAILVSSIMYKLTNNKLYLDKSFDFLESSKSFSLVSEFSKLSAMEFSGLPSEIKEKEKELMIKLKGFNELLLKETTKQNPDSIIIKNIKESYFKVKNDYNTLLSNIEKNYPNYFNLKYNLKYISLEKLQQNLSANQAFVEYSFNENELTVFLIDRNQITLFTQPIDSAFADECYEYYELLRNQSFINGIQSTYQRYQELSRKFYTVLMEPVLERTRKRHITIIPDGPLVYLPFETFLTEDVDPYYANYTKLPYLIYDASIGYGYSATLMYTQHPNKVKTKNKVLAFAPSYENLFTDTLQLVWNREANPDQLVDLQGIYKEVNAIKSIVRSDVYMESAATETNFKENASKYAILHLAMHTILNDEDPMYSRLVFTRTGSDTLNDNDLYTYEVYNLDINAKMTVLSSCSSGFGKMLRGEGFLSLARGFIYAGCPSIIMTLWQAPDNSSPELMTSFYKHLKRGSNKIEALRKSKIEYLKGSDGLWANPYFWSPFVVIGDSSPLYRRQDILYWSLLIGLFSITTIFTVIRMRRKKPRA